MLVMHVERMYNEHLRITEVNSVKPNEDNSGPSGTLVRFGAIIGRSSGFPVSSVSGSNTSNDEVGNGHADAANNEDLLSAKSVDVQDGGDRGEEHDDAHHSGGEEGDRVVSTLASAETDTLEDEGRLLNKISSYSMSLF
jgi:hypothetical protein